MAKNMMDPGFAAMEKKLAGGGSRGNKPMRKPMVRAKTESKLPATPKQPWAK